MAGLCRGLGGRVRSAKVIAHVDTGLEDEQILRAKKLL